MRLISLTPNFCYYTVIYYGVISSLRGKMHNEHLHTHDHEGHHHSMLNELFCHLPYAIFSVAFSLIVLSFFSVFTMSITDPAIIKKAIDNNTPINVMNNSNMVVI